MRLPDNLIHTMRGTKRSQQHVRELNLSTTHLVFVKTGESPKEQERLEVHLEVMPSSVKETHKEGDYGGNIFPPEGVSSFLHVGFIVFDESLVWSYAHLEKPEEPRGNFSSIGQATHALVNAVTSGHNATVYSDKSEKVEDRVHGVLYEQAHASFGCARLYRGQASGGGVFYGSQVSHNHSMSLRISRASSRRDAHHDWMSPTSELIEIEMSVAQFGELLTNQIEGFGVPVTIRHVLGKDMPRVPPLPGIKQLLQDDVRDMAEKLAQELDALKKELAESESKLGKKRTEDLTRHLWRAQETLTSSLPSLHKQFIKGCEKAIQDARATIDASLGIQARRISAQVLAGKKTIEIEEVTAPKILDFEGLPDHPALPGKK